MSSNNKLERIRQGDKSVYKEIIKDCKKLIISYVVANSGTAEDGKGMLQEALVVLVMKARNPDFKLTSNVCSYLKGVVHYKWQDYLRREKNKGGLDNRKLKEINEEVISSIYAGSVGFDKERMKSLWPLFDRLSDKCRTILLKHHVDKIPLEEVAEELNYTYKSIRVASSRCKEKFRALIKKEGLG